jgi:endonuclease YncB( thermonuclease family)
MKCVIGLSFAIATTLTAVSAPVLAVDIAGVPRITDGDTVELSGTKIRLNGIDAPETDQTCLDGKGQRWACGEASRAALARQFGPLSWTCEGLERDRYGRTVAACSAGGQDVNRWMVRAGWALAFVRYDRRYESDERTAQQARAGLWTGAFVAPWDWRKRAPDAAVMGAVSVPANARTVLLGTAPDVDAPAGCGIKGNTRRDGTCVFHRPGGKWYAKVHMGGAGKRWFCSVADAEAAGCREAIQ